MVDIKKRLIPEIVRLSKKRLRLSGNNVNWHQPLTFILQLMLKRLLLICTAFAGTAVLAQDTATNNNFTAVATHNAVSSYHHYIDKQSRLYSGIEFVGYSPKIENIPFFPESTWRRGSIVYDGIFYDTVQMMYDAVKDRVVILHYNGFFRMSLFTEKVSEFSLNGHNFIHIERDSLRHAILETGLYDRMYAGRTTMLVRRHKFIEETVKDVLERKFMDQYSYYLLKGGKYHIIRTKSGLLSLLKDHAREIKQHLRRQKIKFRKDKENAILQAAIHYDSLNN